MVEARQFFHSLLLGWGFIDTGDGKGVDPIISMLCICSKCGLGRKYSNDRMLMKIFNNL